MNSKAVIVVAGLGVAAFISVCFYFDRKRRAASDYKRNIKEKRKKGLKKSTDEEPTLPDMRNPEAVHAFFLEQVDLGEKFLSEGDIDKGVTHFAYGVVICGQPQSLLSFLEQSMPPEVYSLLIQKIPDVRGKMYKNTIASFPGINSPFPSTSSSLGMKVDDVE